MPDPTPVALAWSNVQEASLLTHRVYLREKLSDEWTEVEDLFAQNAEWTVSPTIPTAQLGPRVYGRAIVVGTADWQILTRIESRERWWVKIEFDTEWIDDATHDDDPPPLLWYGVLETSHDQRHAVRIMQDENGDDYDVWTGEQTWIAYGLESLLTREVIRRCWFGDDTAAAVDIAPAFNEDQTKNRRRGTTVDGTYLFSTKPRNQDDYAWSTKQIVQYLLYYCTPTGTGDDVPWLLGGDDLLPETDTPILEQYGRTVLDCLNELLSPARLLGYYVTLHEADPAVPGDLTWIELRPLTYVSAVTDLAGVEIAANPNQVALTLQDARDVTHVVIRETTAGVVDQVVMRGARRRSCCTLACNDGNWEAGFEADLRLEYDAGASADPSYPPDTDVNGRRQRNIDSRQALTLYACYRRFQVPDDWDQLAADGQGGTSSMPVFPADDNVSVAVAQNPRWLRMLPVLPLKDGVDYMEIGDHGTVVSGLGPWSEQPPMVFSPLPSETGDLTLRRYVQLDRSSAAASLQLDDPANMRDFSIRVEVPQFDAATLLHVEGATGGAQHAIAYDTFAPLDEDEPHGEWDYRNFAITVAFEEQRYCEGRYPADADLPAGQEIIRRKTYYAGDGYRQDYLVPNTILGVGAVNGKAIHATGGGFIRDDRPQLLAKAKAAYTYGSIPRRSLSWSAHRVTSQLQIGQFITTLDADARVINSVLTSIAIHCVHGDRSDVSTVSYGTGFVERDQLKL